MCQIAINTVRLNVKIFMDDLLDVPLNMSNSSLIGMYQVHITYTSTHVLV